MEIVRDELERHFHGAEEERGQNKEEKAVLHGVMVV